MAALLALTLWAAPDIADAQAKGASPGAEWEKVVEAAKKEGKLVIFGPAGANARQALADGFEKKFPGVKVEFSGGSGAKLAARLLAERRAGVHAVDVMLTGTTTMLESLLPAGVMEPIAPQLFLPEAIDTSKWWQGRLDYSDDAEKYNLVFTASVKVPITINPKLAKVEEFRSYLDLLHPKWTGKMAMRDPTAAGPGLATATFWYAHPALGVKFMRELFLKQQVVLSQDDRQVVEWAGQGKYAIILAPNELTVTDLKSKGLSLESVGAEKFKEGSYLTTANGSVALIKQPPHPNAAKLYLNWLLSRDGQTQWTLLSGYLSRRLDVPRDHVDSIQVPRDGVEYQANYKERYVRMKGEIVPFMKQLLQR
jgi:iron(III) transport system substrate-binding protein